MLLSALVEKFFVSRMRDVRYSLVNKKNMWQKKSSKSKWTYNESFYSSLKKIYIYSPFRFKFSLYFNGSNKFKKLASFLLLLVCFSFLPIPDYWYAISWFRGLVSYNTVFLHSVYNLQNLIMVILPTSGHFNWQKEPQSFWITKIQVVSESFNTKTEKCELV